jgi:hypothetical protein
LVAPLQGQLPFQKIRDQYEGVTVKNVLINTTLYWYEIIGGQNGSERIYYLNIPQVIAQVMVRLIASMDSLKDNDLLPIPNGMEVQIFDLVAAWFTNQRQMPADMLNNNKDDKQ